MKTTIWVLLIPLHFQTAVAQNDSFSGKLPNGLPNCGQDKASSKEDLDEDGKLDCVEACWNGGSVSGGVFLKIVPNCGKKEIVLDTYGSYADFIATVELPPLLTSKPKLLHSAFDLLFGLEHLRTLDQDRIKDRERADGSFRWLLDWYALPTQPNVAPFEEIRAYVPVWQDGPAKLPPSQIAVLRHPLHRRLTKVSPAQPTEKHALSESVLAVYYAHNHGSLKTTGSCGDWRFFSTKHGVAIQNTYSKRSSWIFVSSGVGVVKLRWPSIARVECDGGLVFVERRLELGKRRELWVINPNSGRLGKLVLTEGSRWKLEKATRMLVTSHLGIRLSDLRSALEPLKDWWRRYDLDGDKRPDTIRANFSGGAHCCYQISVNLTSTKKTHRFPFEIDGGYVGGLDLSQPYHFNVADIDADGLPELMMEIGTYNGKALEIPPSWRQPYGVTGNFVMIGFDGGQVRLSNLVTVHGPLD